MRIICLLGHVIFVGIPPPPKKKDLTNHIYDDAESSGVCNRTFAVSLLKDCFYSTLDFMGFTAY